MANWKLTELEEGVITAALQLLFEQAENKLLKDKLGTIEKRIYEEQHKQAFDLLVKFEKI